MIGHGVACYGSADRYLGMLAATLGRTGEAEGRFLAAAELERQMGAKTWLAHTAYEHGRTLLDVGETERAAPLLAEAASLAESIGMPSLLARVRELGAAAPAAAALPDGLSEREAQVLGLIARGLSNREIGGRSPHQRAHGREPRPQHPAQDRLREPHRGGRLRHRQGHRGVSSRRQGAAGV